MSTRALLASHGITEPDLGQAWEQLYRQRPELFAPLAEPVGLPTEWPVLAALYALAHGELSRVHFSDSQRECIDDAARLLRALTGLALPAVGFAVWSPDCLAFADYERCAFSCAGEPQIYNTVLLAPDFLASGDEHEIACISLHEVQHAAHAMMAAPAPGTYVCQPLVAAIDEMAVGFCEQMVSVALRKQRQVYVRESLQAAVDEGPADDRLVRWLGAVLDLTPGLETQDICRSVSELAICALAADDEAAVSLLNERLRRSRSYERWLEIFAD